MDRRGKYIYGVIPRLDSGGVNANASFRFFIPEYSEAESKAGGMYRVRNTIEAVKESKTSNGVYTVPYQEVGAVVCDSAMVDYRQMPKEILAKQLLTHQRVIEKIMGLGVTVIPMKLGTYAFDEDEVKLILEKSYNLIKDIADKIIEKIEMDVVASWADFTLILKEVSEDKEIKEFKEKLLSSGTKITADDQMKAGCMLKNALDRKSEECTEKIQKHLETINEGVRKHEVMDDKMIMNCAFLIDEAKKDEFYKRIEDLNDEFGEKVNFKCVGPLPVYSFYTLEVKRIQFSEVDSARKRLGILSDWASEEDIKKAYKRQAIVYHPDKNQGRAEANMEFDQIKESYNILLEYAAACRQTRLSDRQAGESRLAFIESEFKKNAILVKVKNGKDW
ncbi:MAG: GvpL/GvpF family gas vesicle protein [Candidatus Omnitrophota bacterium]